MMDQPTADEAQRILRLTHRAALATLGVCALVIVGVADASEDAGLAVGRRTTLLALALGMASVLSRRQAALPTLPWPARRAFALAAVALAAGLGLLGAWTALAEGVREAPLLYTLGGAILTLGATPRAGDGDGR